MPPTHTQRPQQRPTDWLKALQEITAHQLSTNGQDFTATPTDGCKLYKINAGNSQHKTQKRQQQKAPGRTYPDVKSCHSISLKISGCPPKNEKQTQQSLQPILEEGQMPDLTFKSSILNTFKELKEITHQEFKRGASLVVQWLRPNTSNAGGVGSIPSQGTKIPHTSRCSK